MKERQNTAHKGEPSITHKLIICLRDLSHTMRGLYEGRGSQKRVLIVLGELGGETTQRELTQQLGIQPGSASEVIAKLESAGLVARSPSPEDRRTASIALTEEGAAQAREAKAQRAHRHEEMFSCLSEEEQGQLLTLLEKLREDWDARYPAAKQAPSRQGHPHEGDGRHHKHGSHSHGGRPGQKPRHDPREE